MLILGLVQKKIKEGGPGGEPGIAGLKENDLNAINGYVRLTVTIRLFPSGVPSIKTIFASLIVALVYAQSAIAEESVDIRKLMTAYEFQETGLNTLDEEQLNALNRWLVNFTANEAPILKKKNTEVKEAEKASIISQLDGEFVGWTGKTRFVLQNGQVWQQRANETFRSPMIEDPNVEIRKNFMGFYVMEVEGVKRSLRVKRLE